MNQSNNIERRPMRPREWAAMRWVSHRLGAMGVTPNTISIAGIVFCTLGGFAMAATNYVQEGAARWLWLAGAVGVQLRGLCNLFDGMVAVEKGIASPIGELYNEVPDRLSDVAMLVGLGYAIGSSPTLGYLAACVALFVAYTRAQVRVAGAPQDYRGPMAKPHRMFTVTAVCLFCCFMPIAWQQSWWGPRAQWGVCQLALVMVIAGGLITAARRLLGGAKHLKGA